MPRICKAEIEGGCVRFAWDDGFEAAFAARWLLDNAPSSHAATHGQRLRTAEALAAAGPLQKIALDGDAARLDYANDSVAWPHGELRACPAKRPGRDEARVLWPRGETVGARGAIDYKAYLADEGALAAALSDVAVFGLVRLAGAGAATDEAERCVARFGFVRETNYGRLYEVRVVPRFDNLASTARALEPHTDNPYREPAPTLQLLHCIRSAGEGGATFFVDGFALAAWLRDAYPEDFACLARHAVPFAFRSASGEVYATRSPVLRLDAQGALCGIRFNHRALGALDFEPEEIARWYDAYLRLAGEAAAAERRFSRKLEPGDIVIFDNERILHGREAFSEDAERLLSGCYADRDGLLATLARLRGAIDLSQSAR